MLLLLRIDKDLIGKKVMVEERKSIVWFIEEGCGNFYNPFIDFD